MVESKTDRSGPTYATNCRHYRGRTNASCSFRIYGNPTPEASGGVILAEGTGLMTEEVSAALAVERERWGSSVLANVRCTEGPDPTEADRVP